MRQFVEEHPDVEREWFVRSNTLAVVAVPDEPALGRLLDHAYDLGVRASAFREPDLAGAMTAAALEPGSGARRVTRGLALALG